MSIYTLNRAMIYAEVEQLLMACRRAAESQSGTGIEIAEDAADVFEETLKHIRSTPANIVDLVKEFKGIREIDIAAQAAAKAVKESTCPEGVWKCPNCGPVSNGEEMSREELLEELGEIKHVSEMLLDELSEERQRVAKHIIETLKGAIGLLEDVNYDVEGTARKLMEIGVSWETANRTAIMAVRDCHKASGEFMCPYCGEMIEV